MLAIRKPTQWAQRSSTVGVASLAVRKRRRMHLCAYRSVEDDNTSKVDRSKAKPQQRPKRDGQQVRTSCKLPVTKKSSFPLAFFAALALAPFRSKLSDWDSRTISSSGPASTKPLVPPSTDAPSAQEQFGASTDPAMVPPAVTAAAAEAHHPHTAVPSSAVQPEARSAVAIPAPVAAGMQSDADNVLLAASSSPATAPPAVTAAAAERSQMTSGIGTDRTQHTSTSQRHADLQQELSHIHNKVVELRINTADVLSAGPATPPAPSAAGTGPYAQQDKPASWQAATPVDAHKSAESALLDSPFPAIAPPALTAAAAAEARDSPSSRAADSSKQGSTINSQVLVPATAAHRQEGVSAGPLDSWGTGLSSSDDESEQIAKQMVIEMLMHPEDLEQQLLAEERAQAGKGSSSSTSSSSNNSLNISPEYIDALVQAAKEPSIGMPHKKDTAHSSISNSSAPRSTQSRSASSNRDAAGRANSCQFQESQQHPGPNVVYERQMTEYQQQQQVQHPGPNVFYEKATAQRAADGGVDARSRLDALPVSQDGRMAQQQQQQGCSMEPQSGIGIVKRRDKSWWDWLPPSARPETDQEEF